MEFLLAHLPAIVFYLGVGCGLALATTVGGDSEESGVEAVLIALLLLLIWPAVFPMVLWGERKSAEEEEW